LSTASGRFLESRDRISSRDRPVCCDKVWVGALTGAQRAAWQFLLQS
jgi:hypothetical protein